MAHGMQCKTFEKAIVPLTVRLAHVEIGDKRAGMGGRHSGTQPEFARERTGSEQQVALTVSFNQYRRSA